MSKRFSRAYVEIINTCNRSCTFCHGTKRMPSLMALAEFKRIAEQLVPLTDYVYLHVLGEPLKHPYIHLIIESARELGLNVAITTNGTLLSTRGELLLNAKPYKVNISLHSFEKDDTAAQLEYLRECATFARRASDEGILTVLRLWNGECEPLKNDLTLSFLRSYFDGCEWVEGVRGYRIKHRLHLEFADRFDWPDMNADSLGDEVFCYGLSDHFGILVDGSVIPCCLDAEGDMTLGNVTEMPLAEILSSPRARAILDGFKAQRATEELCKRCGYARRFKL